MKETIGPMLFEEIVQRTYAPDAKVVAVDIHGKYAAVLVCIMGQGLQYHGQVIYEESEEGWLEVASGNGPGWTRTVGLDVEADRGVLTIWGTATTEQHVVSVTIHDRVALSIPIVNGMYFGCIWDVPSGTNAALNFG